MTLTDRDIESIIDAVRGAAASEIMPRFRSLSDIEVHRKSGPTDLLTAADLATEARIAEAVGRIWPEAAIIGEEAVAASPDILHDAIGSERR